MNRNADAKNTNPHNCATVADAYALGLERGVWYLDRDRPMTAIIYTRDAATSWKSAESDHAETSYWGVENIRKSRAYFLGCARAIRNTSDPAPAYPGWPNGFDSRPR